MANNSLFDRPEAITWVLVADNRRANIFSCVKKTRLAGFVGFNKHHFPHEAATHELAPVPDGGVRAESIGNYQTGYDLRGMTMNSATAKRTTYEPKGDIKKELRRGYIQAVADKLYHAALENAYYKLVIIAPARLIGDVKERLPLAVRKRIVAEIPKDLAHAPPEELRAQVLHALADEQAPHPSSRI